MRKIEFASVAVILSLSACGGGRPSESTTPSESDTQAQAFEAPPPPPPPPTPARVRVIHASVDPSLANVSVYAGAEATPLIGGLAAASAGLAQLLPGVHELAVRAADAAPTATPALAITSPSLTEGVPYTIVVHGLPGNATAALAAVFAADDTAPGATGDQVPARFFHAIAGAAAVDVCAPGARARDAGTPLFAAVGYGAYGTPAAEGTRGTWSTFAAGTPTAVQVRAANASRPCSGNLIGTTSLTFEPGVASTVVATGRQGQGRRDPGIAKQLLVCAAGATTCVAAPLAAR